MPKCMVCSKSVTAGFVVCGDCADKMKELTKLKPLYLVLGEDGLWAGGFDGGDLQPLFGGTYAELGANLKKNLDTGEYGYIRLVSFEELDMLQDALGLVRMPTTDKCFTSMETQSIPSAWILTDDESCQYARSAGLNGEYELIEMGMVDPEKERYAVYTNTVSTREYIDGRPEELDEILRTYSYNGFADVLNQYGATAMQIIAECIFEYYNIREGQTLFKGSRKECERFIKEFVRGRS